MSKYSCTLSSSILIRWYQYNAKLDGSGLITFAASATFVVVIGQAAEMIIPKTETEARYELH